MGSDSRRGAVPPTVGAAADLAAGELRCAGVDAPRRAAELLLCHVLGWDRVRVLAHDTDPLPAEAWELLSALVRRMAAGEPLQYLTTRQEFYGLLFQVNPAVLIPRPETEILVEKALQLAAAMPKEHCLRIVDVGTGSGCIAVSVAAHLETARIWAVDIAAPALAVARDNAAAHGVAGRIQFLRGDMLSSFSTGGIFDFVLANPPYVSSLDAGNLSATVREYEPHTALFAGESGLEVHRKLAPQAAERLATGGYLLLEVGAGQAREVSAILEGNGLEVLEVAADLQGIPRCVVARKTTGE